MILVFGEQFQTRSSDNLQHQLSGGVQASSSSPRGGHLHRDRQTGKPCKAAPANAAEASEPDYRDIS